MTWFFRKRPQAEDPLVTEARRERVEAMLMDHFSELLGAVAFLDTVDPLPNGGYPRKINTYDFVPIVSGRVQRSKASYISAFFNYILPPDIDEPERIGMDTSRAIGLVKRNQQTGRGVLLAIASAHSTFDANIMVTQMQGVRNGRALGLHGGFSWQRSLYRGWIGVARQTEAQKLIIQGAANNSWVQDVGMKIAGVDPTQRYSDEEFAHFKEVGAEALAKNHDLVADDLHFDQNTQGDWELPLR